MLKNCFLTVVEFATADFFLSNHISDALTLSLPQSLSQGVTRGACYSIRSYV